MDSLIAQTLQRSCETPERGLNYDQAGVACLGSMEAAEDLGIDVNVAVVDSAGHLIVFSRMPNAKVTGIQLAINKATNYSSKVT